MTESSTENLAPQRGRTSRLIRTAWREFLLTCRRPHRVFKVFRPGALTSYARFHGTILRSGDFQESRDGGLRKREFDRYEDYVALQRMKLDYVDLENHEATFRRRLGERLSDLPSVRPGHTALCLGARLGAEVRAFIDLGCFAVGIDLNPGSGNRFVLTGDFHDLQWGTGTVDIVYSNSVDHAFDVEKLSAEILRVLKPTGTFILEADPGGEDPGGVAPDAWAVCSWDRVDDIVARFEAAGMESVSRRRFSYPRNGEQIALRPSAPRSAPGDASPLTPPRETATPGS